MDDSGETPPRSVIRRLSKYLFFIRQRSSEGSEWVLSHEIAETLSLTSATVRRDLSCLDFYGTPKRGYRAQQLAEALQKFLGADEEHSVILVGAGNLGKALALHQGFERHGFHIRAIYDHDPSVVGRRIGHFRVRAMSEIENDLKEQGVGFGVLAVPAGAAQGVADDLVSAGIRGILNLSLAHVTAPDHVSVVDSQVVARLQELACVSRYSAKEPTKPGKRK